MRYEDTGNVHKDFHLALDTTIKYVLKNHGKDFLRELFRRTAQLVYRDIYEHLKKGDWSKLLEHWKYYLEREQAVFDISESSDSATLSITDCPAVRHLKEKGVAVEDCFCLQTTLMNEAWSQNTPFIITTEISRPGSCRQIIKRRSHASE